MQIYWNKRKRLGKIWFGTPRSGGHQHDRRFLVLGYLYGFRDDLAYIAGFLCRFAPKAARAISAFLKTHK